MRYRVVVDTSGREPRASIYLERPPEQMGPAREPEMVLLADLCASSVLALMGKAGGEIHRYDRDNG